MALLCSELAPYLAAAGISQAPPAGQLRELDLVPCRLGGELLVRACLTMRTRVWPSGGAAGGLGGPKGRPMRPECATCSWGEAYASRCPSFVPPPPSRPAEVLSAPQRLARLRQLLEDPGRDRPAGGLDPFSEAALSSPDDSREWR